MQYERVCTVITHPAVPIALSVFLPPDIASTSLLLAGAACSVIPDIDVIGFSFGIKSSHTFGHRGFTHSVPFAALLAGITTLIAFSGDHGSPVAVFSFLFLSTLSHPLLDALTNGGTGVGLFIPFNNQRYFFPWRPIEVSPIGVAPFLSRRGLAVLRSELIWVWLPSAALFALGLLFKRARDVI